jgi:hypothetical protein
MTPTKSTPPPSFWTRNKNLIIAIGLFLVVLWTLTLLYVTYSIPQLLEMAKEGQSFSVSKEHKACTEEAKMCPDGSYVGRTGPNCEFSACPVF